MCSIIPTNTNILIIKTDATELRVPYNTLSLSFEQTSLSTPTIQENTSSSSQYSDKLVLLKEKGFTNEQLNLRVLTNQKGDMDRTVKRLETIAQRKKPVCNIRKPCSPATSNDVDKLIQIKEQGYTNEKLNFRLLRRNNGDVDATIAQLSKVKHVRANKSTITSVHRVRK